MSSNKNVENSANVDAYIDAVDDDQKRADCRALIAMMRDVTGREPKMWGSSMVGFGSYHYRYESGREGDFFLTGFAPRKAALAVYVMPGFDGYREQLERLGPHKTGKSCLYLKNLEVIDRGVLAEILQDSVRVMRSRYDCS